MNAFDVWWRRAIEDARRCLAGSETAFLVDRVEQPSFPGALVLLAVRDDADGPSGGTFLADLATGLADQEDVQAAGLDAAAIRDILSALFVEREPGHAVGQPNDVLERLVSQALEHEGIAVTPDEAREIVQLLATGRFFGDLLSSTTAVFRTIPRLPRAILDDMARLPTLPIALPGTLFADLFDLLKGLRALAHDLRDGHVDTPPEMMMNSLGLLYGFASVDRIRDLLERLLHPDNRSVRLALLLYARSNGFHVTEADLDTVYDTLIATGEPDLGPTLAASLEFMKRRHGGDELTRMLAALQRRGAPH